MNALELRELLTSLLNGTVDKHDPEKYTKEYDHWVGLCHFLLITEEETANDQCISEETKNKLKVFFKLNVKNLFKELGLEQATFSLSDNYPVVTSKEIKEQVIKDKYQPFRGDLNYSEGLELNDPVLEFKHFYGDNPHAKVRKEAIQYLLDNVNWNDYPSIAKNKGA